MRVLIQRVKEAQVKVKKQVICQIKSGFLLLIGISGEDTQKDVEYIAKKIINLRVFEDKQAKMNLNIQQVNGEILSVSQFTLYANTKKGNRPGFEAAADPETAKQLWEELNQLLQKNGITPKVGIFGAHMQIGLINDGPVTILVDSLNR